MTTNHPTCLVFDVEDERFAIPLPLVQQVIRAATLTKLPSNSDLAGLLNLHGEFIPVYDGRQLLGRPRRPLNAQDRIVIVQLRDRRVALLVDHVDGVFPLSEAHPCAFDHTVEAIGAPSRDIGGSAHGAILLLDLEALIPARSEPPSSSHRAPITTSDERSCWTYDQPRAPMAS